MNFPIMKLIQYSTFCIQKSDIKINGNPLINSIDCTNLHWSPLQRL